MFRRVGYMEPIPGEMDFDPSIVGIHYLHGSLEHLDPFTDPEKSGMRVWAYDTCPYENPLPAVEVKRPNGDVYRREALGVNHLARRQLGPSDFTVSGYPVGKSPNGPHDPPAMNYSEDFATDVDDLVIMPTDPTEVLGCVELPSFWGESFNVLCTQSKMLLLRTPAIRMMTGAPELYAHWSGDPAVMIRSSANMEDLIDGRQHIRPPGYRMVPSPAVARAAADRWRCKKQRCGGCGSCTPFRMHG